ncbi:GldL-related protein [Pedobacter sp. NJ-S-72]
MAAKKNSNWLHTAISWGASIVILGALCKILHIGGIWGSYAIGIGLGVEAALFFITGFFFHQNQNWHGKKYILN